MDFSETIKKYNDKYLLSEILKAETPESIGILKGELNSRINSDEFIKLLKNEKPMNIFTDTIFFYHIRNNIKNIDKIKYIFIDRKKEMLLDFKSMEVAYDSQKEILKEMETCLNKNLKYPLAEKKYKIELEYLKNKNNLFFMCYKKYLEYKLKQIFKRSPKKLKEDERKNLESNIIQARENINIWQSILRPVLLSLLNINSDQIN